MTDISKCALPNCSNTLWNGFKLFRFPKNVERNKLWSAFARQSTSRSNNLYLCQGHFESSCVVNGRLVEGSNPTITSCQGQGPIFLLKLSPTLKRTHNIAIDKSYACDPTQVKKQKLENNKYALMYRSCLGFVDSLLGKDQKRSRNLQSSSGKTIYHERQVKELCALHALNNLFQDGNAFTKQHLDTICHSLSPDNIVNPHKSVLGLGNYDVNVLMSALQQKGYEAIWFDKRKDPGCIDVTKIVGFILNIPSDMKFGFLQFPLNRKHWIAVREIDGIYYNMDSKLDSPVPIGKQNELLIYLREQIRSKDKEIFVVVTQEVERTQSWRKDART